MWSYASILAMPHFPTMMMLIDLKASMDMYKRLFLGSMYLFKPNKPNNMRNYQSGLLIKLTARKFIALKYTIV